MTTRIPPWHLTALFMGLLLATCALLGPAASALPDTSAVEGILQSQAGPAADGQYNAVFSIYADDTSPAPLWSEGPAVLTVKNGLWQWPLGSKKPIDLATLKGKSPWLGLQIAADPELPRVKLHSALFAGRAQIAESLDCSGCIGSGALDAKVLEPFAKTADLAPIAKSGKFADLVGAPTMANYALASDLASYTKTIFLADVAKTGAYGDLKGLPVVPKANTGCGTGLVVRGIKADGSLDCVSGVDPLVAQLFSPVVSQPFVATPNVPILDGQPAGYVSGELTLPALGAAELIEIDVDIDNSDVSQLKIEAAGPAGPLLVLYDGGATGTSLKTTFPTKMALVVGSLDSWKGLDPKGKWSIYVHDKIKKANSTGTDGVFKSFAIRVSYKAANVVQVKSDIVGPDAMPYTKKRSAQDDALADGSALTLQTGGDAPLLAQGWLWDKSLNVWIEANTGASSTGGCPSCGGGKDGDYVASANGNLVAGNYEFKSFAIKDGVTITVTGGALLSIKVQGSALIDGLLDLRGGNAPDVNSCCPESPAGTGGGGGGGAGGLGPASSGSTAGAGPGAGGGGCAAGYGSGGGGAGHASAGAAGTTSPASCGPAGTAGNAYGDATLATGLEPGSGGGSGGFGGAKNASGSGGGGGGGAVLLVASKITVSAKGQIRADGGMGGAQLNDYDGGAGGGGSGGAIWLRASQVTVVGTVSAKGGLGGLASKVASYGGDGGNGAVGRIVVDSVTAAQGTTSPVAATGSLTGLDLTGTNKFSLQNNGLGLVSLINQSGAVQKVLLVVMY